MTKEEILSDVNLRMEKSLAALDHDLKGIRSGRASPNLLDPVVIEAYGDKMPISQMATVSAPEARTIVVQVWDKQMVKNVEKAIANANLGLNTATDGQLIRINIPPLNEERRKELAKLASKYGESSKVAIRNVRRDVIEIVKKLEKDSKFSKDESHNLSEEIQKITDNFTKKIDDKVSLKESEIMDVSK